MRERVREQGYKLLVKSLESESEILKMYMNRIYVHGVICF